MILKDSGERREFASGAKRDMSSGKDRPALISPFALLRVGGWFAKGAHKYGDRNWELGMPYSVFIESAMRHLLKWMCGKRDEDHLAAVIFNIQAIIHFEELGRVDLDDMPKYGGMNGKITAQRSKAPMSSVPTREGIPSAPRDVRQQVRKRKKAKGSRSPITGA